MAYLKESLEMMKNYVFQNKFKAYFHSNFEEILDQLSPISKIDKCKALSYTIDGIFGQKMRTINFPNIFSYAYAVNEINKLNIVDFGKMASSYNKMKIDFDKRKFLSNSYSEFLEERINYLISDYDKLYKIDIQSFYKSIYTHVFDKLSDSKLSTIDDNIRIFNNKKTNGILLGNLFSTYSANEIMNYLSNEIQITLKEAKVFYFSDQFYIFYNNSSYNDKYIYKTVNDIISKDYFEFKINDNDSVLYNHEILIKEKNFDKMCDDLFMVQRSDTKNIDDSSDKLVHFFNGFIEDYYLIEPLRRESFVEVVMKRVFSSTANLYRLARLLKLNQSKEDNDKIISILFLFLKTHPTLIIFYIEIGIWDIIMDNSNYISERNSELKKYFELKLESNILLINAVYYFHICYMLVKPEDREKYCYEYLKKYKGQNLFLESIIVETCNIKENKNIIFSYKYNDTNWLINYTKFMQIRYYLPLNSSSNCFVKTINNCKKNNIKIIRSLNDICFETKKKINYFKVIRKFEK